MDLILAHVWNRMAGKHGVIFPTCLPCFDATGRRWARDETLALRLDEVTDPEAKPHLDYSPNECFYCHMRVNPQYGCPRAVKP